MAFRFGAASALVLACACAPVLAQDVMPSQARAFELSSGMLADKRFDLFATPIDDALSARVFDAWLATFDPQAMLVSQAELAQYDTWRTTFDDAAKARDFAAPLAMSDALRSVTIARAEVVRARIPSAIADTGADDWSVRNATSARPVDAAARDALWQRRLRHEVRELRAAGIADARIAAMLTARYARIAQDAKSVSARDLADRFIGVWTRTADPDGDYYAPPRDIANKPIDFSRVGVGATLERKDGVIRVQSTMHGPAREAGLRRGDRILAIAEGANEDFVDVAADSLEGTVERMRGDAGSVVRVVVVDAQGKVRTVSITRARVPVKAIELEQSTVSIDGKSIGVLRPGNLYKEAANRNDPNAETTTNAVRIALESMRASGVAAIVLDLRENGGGMLTEAVDFPGLFLGRRPVVAVVEGDGRVSIEASRQDVAWNGPLVVLVDRGTSSGAEVIAATLQDHGRALVVGDGTYGRGTIQIMLDLDRLPQNKGLGSLKVTLAQMFRIDGRPIGAGVTPDVAFTPGAPAVESRVPVPAARPAVRDGIAKPVVDRTLTAGQRPLLEENEARPDPALSMAATIAAEAAVDSSASR